MVCTELIHISVHRILPQQVLDFGVGILQTLESYWDVAHLVLQKYC